MAHVVSCIVRRFRIATAGIFPSKLQLPCRCCLACRAAQPRLCRRAMHTEVRSNKPSTAMALGRICTFGYPGNITHPGKYHAPRKYGNSMRHNCEIFE